LLAVIELMKKLDLFTVVSLAGLTWSTLMIAHELFGHGGAVLLVSGTPISVDGMYFTHDISNASFWQEKFVRAAGSIVNIIIALASIFIFTRLKQPRSWLGYFLWLVIMMNCFSTGNYIAFGRFIHPGMDWAQILKGLEPSWAWKTAEFLCGLLLIGVGFYIGRKYHYYFINKGSSLLRQKTKILTIPLLTAACVSVLASMIVPTDDRFMLIMGGIGNGFTFLIGMLVLTLIPTSGENITDSIELKRSYGWILFSLLIVTFYLLVMSPGINFS